MKYEIRLFFPLLTLLTSCTLPPVALTTPKPMEVDIKMRVDVYQYASNNSSKKKPKEGDSLSSDEDAYRSNRRADLQSYKNGNYIGEGHDGLLMILNEPTGDLGNRVRQAVEAENVDRSVEMQAIAKKENVSLSVIQNRQGELNRLRAFKGEWLEQPLPDGTFKWIQKGS